MCPVKACISLILRAREFPITHSQLLDTPINTVFLANTFYQIPSEVFLGTIRRTVKYMGLDTLGFGPEDIGTHSNFSAGAMSMFLSGTSTLTGGDKVVLSLRVLTDSNQQEHQQIAYEKTTGSKVQKRTKTRPCTWCLSQEKKHHLVGFGCYTCGISLCCPNAANADQDCFLQHVRSICWWTNRNTEVN